MILYPAIDLKNQKCVRLLQGKTSDMTVYSSDPVKTAIKWESLGAKFLHVVDLDGALESKSPNVGIISDIVKAVTIPVQVGGGIRTMEKIKQFLEDFSVRRVILGTAAINNVDIVIRALRKYGNRIAIGVDAKDGKVAINGWLQSTDVSAVDLAIQMKELGVETVIYTDISKDGMMKGPNLEGTKAMVRKTGMNIIASGGVSRLKDLSELKKLNVSGAIIGKALYTGAVKLPDALAL